MKRVTAARRSVEMGSSDRYKAIGLKVGLELHQQVDSTRKLFCHCPPVVREDEPRGRFMRRLRPAQSEMGAVDPAALFEFQKQKRFYYEYYNDTTCLVEADEEPPHDLNAEAVDVCLTMANLLKSTPVHEIHPMRKIVIDGSNTTGFQRTCVVASGGLIVVGNKPIGIQTICLEEDAARKTADDEAANTRTYRLDRLGIPLIEIATAPDIRSPEEARDAALAIGLLLRSTGRVKRGLGTIRQDVNVSIRGGNVIEIKGLQQLDLLEKTVEFEVLRQEGLLKIRDVLLERRITHDEFDRTPRDVSDVFVDTESKVIRKVLNSVGAVFAVLLPGFAGLVGLELQPERRFGTELSDYAKFWGGVGGIFHTDELPQYGITASEVIRLRASMSAGDNDAVVIVAAPDKNCMDALQAVLGRARAALDGVTAETRAPLPNGTSKYARPRPGAERMYPETDVRPVKVTSSHLKRIAKEMPETLEEKEKRFVEEYSLSNEMASQMARSLNLDLFEALVKDTAVSPTLLAATLENTVVSLQRDGVQVERLEERHLRSVFQAVSRNAMTPEGIPAALREFAQNPNRDLQEVLAVTHLGAISHDDVELLVRKIFNARVEYIHEHGEESISGLMGIVMKEVRGRADGKTVKELLLAEVRRILAGQ